MNSRNKRRKDILLIDLVVLIFSAVFGWEGIFCTFIGELLITGWLFFG